jgi:hypothetical protein
MRILAALLLLAGLSTSASAVYLSRSVRVNDSLKGIAYMTLNPDCSPVGYPSVRLVAAPSNGSVSIFKGSAFPVYASTNPRSACILRRRAGTLIEYRPRRNFEGSDSFTLDIIFPDGGDRTDSFNITVK